MLTLSSSTDSDGEHRAGQAPGTNDSDDIQTISSGSEEEEGEDKKNASSGSGEGKRGLRGTNFGWKAPGRAREAAAAAPAEVWQGKTAEPAPQKQTFW